MGRTPLRRVTAAVVAALGIATSFSLMTAAPASASITTPANGATVRGNVGITENRGGQDNCAFGSSGENTRIEVRDGAGNVVFNASKNDGGGYSVTWSTVNARPNGSYNIRSYGRDITNGFFRCNTGGEYLISSIGVTLTNRSFLNFTSFPASGYHGEPATFAARLTNELGAPITGRTITFSMAGQSGGIATTNSSGVAALAVNVTRGVGSAAVSMLNLGSAYDTLSSANGTFTVLPRPTELVNSGPLSALSHDSFVAAMVLTDGRNGAKLPGRDVLFELRDGSTVISGASTSTDGDGVAAAELLAGAPAGDYTLAAAYPGEANYVHSAVEVPFTIGLRPTSLVHTGAPQVLRREILPVTVALADESTGAPLPGEAVHFAVTDVDGANVLEGTLVTDDNGVAAFEIGDLPAGSYTLKETFGGNGVNGGAESVSTFDVVRRDLGLVVESPDSVFAGEAIDVTVTAIDGPSGVAEPGHALAVELADADGNVVVPAIDAVTGDDGSTTVSVPVELAAGIYTLRTTAPATADHLAASAEERAVDVLERPTALAYTGAASGTRGSTVTLSASLVDERSGAALAGQPVSFTLGSFSADATTDDAGVASVDVTLDQDPGTYDVVVGFAGEAGRYAGASLTAPFALGWEHVFTSALGDGTIYLNPSTQEFQFEAPGDSSGIVHDPGMVVQSLPLAGDAVLITYSAEGLSVLGEFNPATGVFAAVVRTAAGDYVLGSAG